MTPHLADILADELEERLEQEEHAVTYKYEMENIHHLDGDLRYFSPKRVQEAINDDN